MTTRVLELHQKTLILWNKNGHKLTEIKPDHNLNNKGEMKKRRPADPQRADGLGSSIKLTLREIRQQRQNHHRPTAAVEARRWKRLGQGSRCTWGKNTRDHESTSNAHQNQQEEPIAPPPYDTELRLLYIQSLNQNPVFRKQVFTGATNLNVKHRIKKVDGNVKNKNNVSKLWQPLFISLSSMARATGFVSFSSSLAVCKHMVLPLLTLFIPAMNNTAHTATFWWNAAVRVRPAFLLSLWHFERSLQIHSTVRWKQGCCPINCSIHFSVNWKSHNIVTLC